MLPMKDYRLLRLIAAHLVGAILGMMIMLRRDSATYLLIVWAISLASAQGSLLGIWVALAGKARPWRFAVLIVVLVTVTRMVDVRFGDSHLQGWGYFLLAQMIGTGMPLFLMRFLGMEMAKEMPDDSTLVVYRAQFSILALLEWTVVVAILLGLVPMMPEEFRKPFTSPEECCVVFGLFGLDAFLGMASLWIALGTRWTPLRGLVLGLIGMFLGLFLAMMMPDPEVLLIIVFPVFHVLWLVASLWVFRTVGYRLVWRRAVRC